MKTPHQNTGPTIVPLTSNKVQLRHTAPFIVSHKMSPKPCMNTSKKILPKASSAILQEFPYYSIERKWLPPALRRLLRPECSYYKKPVPFAIDI